MFKTSTWQHIYIFRGKWGHPLVQCSTDGRYTGWPQPQSFLGKNTGYRVLTEISAVPGQLRQLLFWPRSRGLSIVQWHVPQHQGEVRWSLLRYDIIIENWDIETRTKIWGQFPCIVSVHQGDCVEYRVSVVMCSIQGDYSKVQYTGWLQNVLAAASLLMLMVVNLWCSQTSS